jgi:hypothetical protein
MSRKMMLEEDGFYKQQQNIDIAQKMVEPRSKLG